MRVDRVTTSIVYKKERLMTWSIMFVMISGMLIASLIFAINIDSRTSSILVFLVPAILTMLVVTKAVQSYRSRNLRIILTVSGITIEALTPTEIPWSVIRRTHSQRTMNSDRLIITLSPNAKILHPELVRLPTDKDTHELVACDLMDYRGGSGDMATEIQLYLIKGHRRLSESAFSPEFSKAEDIE